VLVLFEPMLTEASVATPNAAADPLGSFAQQLYADLYRQSRAQLSQAGRSPALWRSSPSLPPLSLSSPDPVLQDGSMPGSPGQLQRRRAAGVAQSSNALANRLNQLATFERPVPLVDAQRPNPLQNPNGQGPIGPRTRHKRFIVVNLEYPDYNPSDPPAEFARMPLRPPNAALYLEYCQNATHKTHTICAGFQPEVAAGGLHHVQGFYTDTRKRPNYVQQREEWAFRGVSLQPWQYRSYDCDNPAGAFAYAIKGPDYIDPATGKPDTGKRMEGGYPRTFGMPPPPGPIQQGGHRDEAGRTPGSGNKRKAGAADDVDMVAWAKHIEDMAKQKKTKLDLYTDPKVLSALKPTQTLLETIHRLHDRPSNPDPEYKRRLVIIYGAGNSGKSYRVEEWCKKNGISLWIAPKQKQGYGGFYQRYAGEKAALFDEGHNWISFDAFLTATHSRESLEDQKNGDCVFRPDYIFITSNAHPEEWLWYFPGEKLARPMRDYEKEKKPFYRRLDWGGIYRWIDDDFHEMIQDFLPDIGHFDPAPKRYYMKIPRLYNFPAVRWDPPYILKGELRFTLLENQARGVDMMSDQLLPVFRAPPPISPSVDQEPESPVDLRTPVDVATPVSPVLELTPGVDYPREYVSSGGGGTPVSDRSVSLGDNTNQTLLDVTGLGLDDVVAPLPDSPDARVIPHEPILADLLATLDGATPDLYARQLEEEGGSAVEEDDVLSWNKITPPSDLERALEDQEEERFKGGGGQFLLLEASEEEEDHG
jgi:hypothetical protein